jgi:iron(III) transport system permease protein
MRHLRLINYRILLIGVFIVIATGLVIVPAVFLLTGSFSSGMPYEKDRTFTLENYRQLFATADLWKLIWNTFWVATLTTIFTVIWGVSLAWIITRTNLPFGALIEQLLIIPFYFSPFMGGICWSLLAAPRVGILNMMFTSAFPFLGRNGPFNAYTSWGIIWTMSLYFVPFVFLFTSGALKSMDATLEESSQMSGATKFKTAVKITLPLVLPAIAGGSLLVFILAISQFGVPAILGLRGKFYVIATRLYTLVASYPPQYTLAASLGIFFFAVTAILVYVQTKILGKRQFTTVTGRGFRPRKIILGTKLKVLMLLYCLFYLVVAVILPIGVLLWTSLIKYLVPKLSMAKYTLAHYADILFVYPPTRLAIKNSLILSIIGATIAIVLTGGIAWILHRTRLPGRKLLEYITMFPIAIPGVIFAVALLWTWISVPYIYGTIWLLLICYITVYMPYGIRSTSATLIQLDKSMEECAQVCGSSWLHTIKTITVPLLRPGIIAGWTLLFIIFSRELVSSVFLSTSKSVVISVAMYDLYFQGVWGKLAAMSMIQTVITFSVLSIARKLGGTRVIVR